MLAAKVEDSCFRRKKSILHHCWSLKFDEERPATFVKFKRARFTLVNIILSGLIFLFVIKSHIFEKKFSLEERCQSYLSIFFSAKETINSRIRACSIFEKYVSLGGFLYLRNTPWGEPPYRFQTFVLRRNKKKRTNHTARKIDVTFRNRRDFSSSIV